MQDARLEQLFERFRRHGDVPALGQVFDETAGELLGVAMGLVREPGEADDLLQETFLTAIERAGRYESGRRLVPWLLGILVHHARERRRLARRALDAARLERGEPERPEQHLFGVEVEREVERALSELSARERVVLEAYLKQGKGAAEIALELGGSPGAVRMQIHRGLERLRKALPAGLALGTAGGALSAQGLGGVRAVVLRAGETAAESLALGAGSAAGGLASKLGFAGVLVGKKSIVALAVAAAFLALFFTWRGTGTRNASGRSVGSAPMETVLLAQQEAPLVESGTLDTPLGAGRGSLAGERAALGEDPLVGSLRGRLVERSGAPVAGKEVTLLEIEEQALFAGFQLDLSTEPPRVFVASATSGEDGVFVLSGARPHGAMQGLGIDLGGSRPSVRVLDVGFAPGECVELGDIVLAPTGVLRGRVVDERGAPVAGARVRAAELTDFLRQFGLYELAAGTALGELRSHNSHEARLANGGIEVRYLLEIPGWLGTIEERLPFSTAHTDERGEFVIAEAPAERLTLLLDRPGRTTVAAATVTLTEGDTTDAGTLTLDAGRTLAGRVLDASGKPVAGAEVRAGRAVAGTDVRGPALFGPGVTTDAEGRFRVTGVSTLYEAALVARRDAASAWTSLFAQGEAIELRLESESELVASVVDSEQEPIQDVAFEFLPGREASNVGAFAAGPRPVQARSLGAGRWSLGTRSFGSYQLRARAPGFASTSVPCKVPAAGPIELVLQRALFAEVRVVSAEDGVPLAGALVTAELESERNAQVASATTDDEGRVRLELPDAGKKALWLRAEHAHFAPRSQRLADPRAPVTLALGPGGSVIARADPRSFGAQRHMLMLEYRGVGAHFELRFPRLAAFDGEGVARRRHLPAGQWSWSVLESLVADEALGFLGEREAPRTLARGEFELAEGEVLEFDIASVAVAQATGTGVVHGTVRVNGAPAEGVTMFLTSMTPGAATTRLPQVDAVAGLFRFEGLEAGSYFLTAGILGEGAFSQLGSKQFELALGEAREFLLDYSTVELEVEVTNEAGERVAGAQLMLWPLEGQGTLGGCNAQTDQEGATRLMIAHEGKYRLTASHPEFGMSAHELDLVPGHAGRLGVRLERGVPCAGLARLAAGTLRPADPVVLTIRREGGNVYFAQTQVSFEADEAPFSFIGLSPGRYLVSALIADRWEPEVVLEVPQWGSTTLELVLGLPAPEPPR